MPAVVEEDALPGASSVGGVEPTVKASREYCDINSEEFCSEVVPLLLYLNCTF